MEQITVLPFWQVDADPTDTHPRVFRDSPVLEEYLCPHVKMIDTPYGPRRGVPYTLELSAECDNGAGYVCLDCLIDWLGAAGLARRVEEV